MWFVEIKPHWFHDQPYRIKVHQKKKNPGRLEKITQFQKLWFLRQLSRFVKNTTPLDLACVVISNYNMNVFNYPNPLIRFTTNNRRYHIGHYLDKKPDVINWFDKDTPNSSTSATATNLHTKVHYHNTSDVNNHLTISPPTA